MSRTPFDGVIEFLQPVQLSNLCRRSRCESCGHWQVPHLRKSPAAEIDPVQIYLLGHSRGGAISILKAAEDSRVKKIVTWAAVSDFISRNKQSTIDSWKEMGVVHTFNARTKQQMPLYYQFYENLQNNKERLNILKAASRLSIPFLIIHGTDDEAVSAKDAQDLHKACKHSQLYLMEGAKHTFGAKHPFEAEDFPEHAKLTIKKTIEFFKGI